MEKLAASEEWTVTSPSTMDLSDEDVTYDKTMFQEGKVFLPPPLCRWRRLSLKVLQMEKTVRSSQLTDIAVGRKMPVAVVEECTHPLYARYRSGNVHGRFVHCRACKTRLSYIKPEPKKAAKDKEPPSDETKKAVNRPKAAAPTPAPRGRPSKATLPVTPSQKEMETEIERKQMVDSMASLSSSISQIAGALTELKTGQEVLVRIAAASSGASSSVNK